MARLVRANLENLEQRYGKNSVDYYRAVFLSNLGRSFALMLLFVHVIILFPGTAFLDTETKLWLAPFVLVLVALLYVSAWLVENGNQRGARLLTNFTVSVSTMISVILCGGFIGSHATPFLLAPIVVCFCISPRREAMFVGTATFVIPLFVDLTARAAGWEIPNFTSTSSPEANTIFLMVTLFITLLISLSYLQKTNDELHAALHGEKQVFETWASLDPLTEIGNRRYFDLQLETEIGKAQNDERELVLLFLDLNGFKQINDRLGHDAGDELLKVMAKRLAETVPKGSHLARLGGDEFAILLTSPGSSTRIDATTNQIRATLERAVVLDGENHTVSASIGKATFPADAMNPSDLVRAADMDMYARKMSMKLSQRHQQLKQRSGTDN